jgi:hypothetical protein
VKPNVISEAAVLIHDIMVRSGQLDQTVEDFDSFIR